MRALPIASITQRGWKDTLMLLASDGVWDLWGFDEVSTELVSPTNGNTVAMKQRADKFFEATRAKGNEYFGESADNLTGVLVNLAPVKKPSLARPRRRRRRSRRSSSSQSGSGCERGVWITAMSRPG